MAAETTNMLGHTIPHAFIRRICRDRTLPLWDEGLLLATIGTGVAWGAIWLMSIMIPFVPKMPGADADTLGILVHVGLFLSLIGALLGMVVHIRYRFLLRKSTPDYATMHRLVACHRLQAAFLLLMVSMGAIVHSWNIQLWLGVVSSLLVGLLLVISYHKLPQSLSYLVYGPDPRIGKVVMRIEVVLPMVFVIGTGLSLIKDMGTPFFFAALSNLMALIGTPFIFTMLAVAAMHLRAARSDVQ